MFTVYTIETYQDYLNTLKYLGDHPENDWHKLPAEKRDALKGEVEEWLTSSIWKQAAYTIMKDQLKVNKQKRQPRKEKKAAETVEQK